MVKEIIMSDGIKLRPFYDVGNVALLKAHRYVNDDVLKRRALRIIGYSFNADEAGNYWIEYVGECLCTYELLCFLENDVDFLIRG